MAIVTAAGVAKLTTHGKRMVTESMYAKGNAFLGAAILLRQMGGYEYVVLHLICQGIEITLKGLLLAIDYDRFRPELKRLSHNLLAVAEAVISVVGLAPMRPHLKSELEGLNRLYSQHLLRYGSVHDILVDPKTIPSKIVLRRMVAVLRLVKREGSLDGKTI